MTAVSPYLADLGYYERTVHGWVDAPDAHAFRITARMVDPWVGLELTAVTTPSPEYGIREAAGRVLVGTPDRIDPSLADGVAGLAGVAMTSGFTRTVGALAADRAGTSYLIDAAVEVARLARQVTRLPRGVVERGFAEGALGVWRLDMQGWVDFPSSCYVFRPEAEHLFQDRAVTTSAPPVIYAPGEGATRVFNRTKVARLERLADRVRMSHSMFDEVHSFQVWYVLDPDRRVIVDAGSLTPRLPYAGLCSDVQPRVRALVGQLVDAGLRKRLGALVGGTTGCSQLYDLTADLLKLLTLP